MPVYLVTYDVSSDDAEDREKLKEQLKQGPWVQVSESSYAVHRKEKTADKLYERLSSALQNTPISLYVFEINNNLSGNSKNKDANEWLANFKDKYSTLAF